MTKTLEINVETGSKVERNLTTDEETQRQIDINNSQAATAKKEARLGDYTLSNDPVVIAAVQVFAQLTGQDLPTIKQLIKQRVRINRAR